VQRAGQCDVVDVVAGRACERTVPTPSRDATVNETRIDRETVVRSQTKPFRHAGPKAFDQDIGPPNERLDRGNARGALQIDRDRVPAAGEQVELSRSGQAQVYRLRTFDPQDVRAQVRQEHPAERSWTDSGQFDDLDPSERAALHDEQTVPGFVSP
jgi:hypothetical protein